MNTDVLTVGSDDDFRLRAFKDFLTSKNEKYQGFLQSITDAIQRVDVEGPSNGDEPDIEWVMQQGIRTKTLVLNDLKTKFGYDSEDYVTLQGGYVKVGDVIELAVNDTMDQCYGLDRVSSISLVDLQGQTIEEGVPFQKVVDEMKSTLHSSVCLEAACEAMVEGVTTPDRITIFNDMVKTFFENAYADLSNSTAFLKRTALQAANASEFFISLDASMQFEDVSNIDEPVLPSDTDFAKYAGVSPIGAIATGAASGMSAVGQGIATGVKLVANVVGSLLKTGWSLFKRAVDKVKQVVVDPEDIEYLDEKSDSYTVDGWFCPMSAGSNFNYLSRMTTGVRSTDSKISKAAEWITNHVGKWFKIDDIGCEILLRFNATPVVQPVNGEFAICFDKVDGKIPIDCYVKPKALSSAALGQLKKRLTVKGLITGASDVITWGDYISCINDFKNNCNALYSDVSNGETQLYHSFANGFVFSNDHMVASLLRLKGEYADGFKADYSPHFTSDSPFTPFYDAQGNKTAITNADFISLLCGRDDEDGHYNTIKVKYAPFQDNSQVVTEQVLDCENYVKMVVDLIIYHALDQTDNPLSFSFFPFRFNKEGWRPATFRIKTDQENYQALEDLVTVATVIVIAAAVTATALFAMRQISRALTRSHIMTQARLQAKLNAGQTLTLRETKQFLRSSKKVVLASGVCSGLQSGSGAVSDIVSLTSGDTDSQLQNIANTLK